MDLRRMVEDSDIVTICFFRQKVSVTLEISQFKEEQQKLKINKKNYRRKHGLCMQLA